MVSITHDVYLTSTKSESVTPACSDLTNYAVPSGIVTLRLAK